MGNNLPGISDNVRERGLEQKCSHALCERVQVGSCGTVFMMLLLFHADIAGQHYEPDLRRHQTVQRVDKQRHCSLAGQNTSLCYHQQHGMISFHLADGYKIVCIRCLI